MFPPVFHASQGRFSSWTSPKLCILRQKQTWVSIVNNWRLSSLVLHLGSYWLKVFSWTLPNHTTPDGPNPWDQGLLLCLSLASLLHLAWATCEALQLASAPLSAPLGPWKGGETRMERLMQSAWVRLNFSALLPKLDAKMEPLTVSNLKGDLGLLKAILSFLFENLSPVSSYLQDL